jgi:hypothetical protein
MTDADVIDLARILPKVARISAERDEAATAVTHDSVKNEPDSMRWWSDRLEVRNRHLTEVCSDARNILQRIAGIERIAK